MNHTMTWYLNALLDFGEDKHLIAREDRAYTMNRLLEICHMDAPEDERADRAPECETATAILNAICDHAVQRGLFPDSAQRRDLFSAKLMGALTPHPQMVRERFYKLYSDLGSAAATQDFYRMCRNVDYIRVDRPSRKRIRAILRRRRMQSRPATPNACCALKIPATRGEWISPRARTTASCRYA